MRQLGEGLLAAEGVNPRGTPPPRRPGASHVLQLLLQAPRAGQPEIGLGCGRGPCHPGAHLRQQVRDRAGEPGKGTPRPGTGVARIGDVGGGGADDGADQRRPDPVEQHVGAHRGPEGEDEDGGAGDLQRAARAEPQELAGGERHEDQGDDGQGREADGPQDHRRRGTRSGP